jgi:cytochrome oxidase complex assembly protein 1
MTTKKTLLLIGTAVFVLTLILAIFVGGIVGLGLYQVGNSEAAAKAKDFLRNSDKLKSDIGDVTDFGSIITGSINFKNLDGQAVLNLKVIGERKTVNATVQMLYTNGSQWRVSGASYVDADGQTINLLDPYDSQVPTPVLIA